MSDLPDYQKAIADAEAAASRGEMTVTAEALQRAAVLQTAALGPAHPDLANTLNNLGVVAERLGWFEEAEAAYRRANTIAEASLPPDHPFVGTSQRNLRDFCIARGLPIEVLGTRAFEPETAPESLDHAPAPVTVVPDVITPEVVALARVETTMRAARDAHSARRLAAIVAAVLVLAVMAIVLYRTTLGRDSAGTTSGQRANATPVPGPAVLATDAPSATALTTAPDTPATPIAPVTMAQEPVATPPAAVRASSAHPSRADTARRPERSASVTTTVPPSPAPIPAPVSAASVPRPEPFPRAATRDTPSVERAPDVVDARVCRALDMRRPEWICTSPSNPAPAGTFYFVTRLVTPRDAVVEHRWYRGDRLIRVRTMTIKASASPGYRAYSQLAVGAREAGDWRVDLVARDGHVLKSMRFTVH